MIYSFVSLVALMFDLCFMFHEKLMHYFMKICHIAHVIYGLPEINFELYICLVMINEINMCSRGTEVITCFDDLY